MEYKNLTLNELFRTSLILREFAEKVEQLTKLNRKILSLLDPTLSKQCRVTSHRDGILILTTSSPAWGHTLRFSELELLTALRQHPEWAGLKAVRVQVRPEEKKLISFNRQNLAGPTKLTQQAASLLQSAATEIASPLLREALLKLAKKAKS